MFYYHFLTFKIKSCDEWNTRQTNYVVLVYFLKNSINKRQNVASPFQFPIYVMLLFYSVNNKREIRLCLNFVTNVTQERCICQSMLHLSQFFKI